jgi:hypothetical protein
MLNHRLLVLWNIMWSVRNGTIPFTHAGMTLRLLERDTPTTPPGPLTAPPHSR